MQKLLVDRDPVQHLSPACAPPHWLPSSPERSWPRSASSQHREMNPNPNLPSLRGGCWARLCPYFLSPYVQLLPASLLPPGVHFILLASTISHSVLTLELSYLGLHMSLSGSHLSWFCLLFPTLSLLFEPDDPQGPQRKVAFSSVPVHTPVI